MSAHRCPTCDKIATAAPGNASFPFCSGRCKLVDLGNWLDGRYRVPGEPVEVDGLEREDEAGSAS